jgi:nitrate/TMAO reductase-like tetraheme cytochrome c subunit
MFSDGTQIANMHPIMAALATGVALLAAAILVWYLVRRPPLDGVTKLRLLFGLGVLPLIAMLVGNVAGLIHSQHREFCGSCHVMAPYAEDSANPESQTLAARHARNTLFGHQNCYTCHQDYGMFGAVMTKLGGMRHVWEYYTEYKDYPVEEAFERMELYKPFSNAACMTCHSTTLEGYLTVDDHRGTLDEIRTGETSCVSSGCHGPAHPFSKPPEEEEGTDEDDGAPTDADGSHPKEAP